MSLFPASATEIWTLPRKNIEYPLAGRLGHWQLRVAAQQLESSSALTQTYFSETENALNLSGRGKTSLIFYQQTINLSKTTFDT